MLKNKFLPVVAAVAVSVFAFDAAFAGETADRVKKTGVMVDAVVNDYPPFSYLNDQNELAGFDIDVGKAVAEKLGVKLKLETPGWETIIGGHWAGRWDVAITSSTPTDERAKVVDFPVNYYSVPAVLVVHKDEKNIKSIADVSGKKVGVGNGSSYEAYVSGNFSIPGQAALTFPFKNVQAVPGDETVNFKNLELGAGVRLDAIVASIGTAEGYTGEKGKLRIVGEPLFAEPNAVVTDKGDAEWDAQLKAAIEALHKDGTLEKISQKWFKTDITKYAFAQ